jgi:AraC family transcriptional regulator, activator of mtrCDE
MAVQTDWLSRFLEMVPVDGRVDNRCFLGAPWRLENPALTAGEMHYHIVLGGIVILEEPGSGPPQALSAGDILLLPDGAQHVLHDGSGRVPEPAHNRKGSSVTYTMNDGRGDQLDMLCGRFIVSATHQWLLRRYLPKRIVVSTSKSGASTAPLGTRSQLTALVSLMRNESAVENLGVHDIESAFDDPVRPHAEARQRGPAGSRGAVGIGWPSQVGPRPGSAFQPARAHLDTV